MARQAMSTVSAVIIVVLLIIVGVAGFYVGGATTGGKTTTQTSTVTQTSAVQVAAKPLATIKIVGVYTGTNLWTTQKSNDLISAAKFYNKSGYSVYVTNVYNVPDSSSEPLFVQYAQAGYNMIYASDVGYESVIVPKLTTEFPNIVWWGTNWYAPFTNTTANYDEELYQSDYVCGVIAGMITKSNVIGEVTGYEFPTTVAGFNAFVLGAKSVNPAVKGIILTTNSWYDTVASANAINALKSQGADVVIGYGLMQIAPQAVQAGLYTFGIFQNQTNSPLVLTNAVENGTLAFIHFIAAYLDGNFGYQTIGVYITTGEFYFTPYSPDVPANVAAKATSVYESIQSGNFTVPFIGTLNSTA